MSRIVFSPVTPADDAELRALLARNVMEGGISVSFRREPSYFAATAVQGERAQIYKGCDVEGRIVMLGSRFRRPAYLNGTLCDTGYLADLRIDKRHRNGLHLYRGYRVLAEKMAAEPLAAEITMILHDNAAALSTIAANRAGMPRYTPLGMVHTPVIGLTLPRRALDMPGIEIRAGRPQDAEALFAFLNREHARRQFAPHYRAEDLAQGRLKGLGIGDFLLAFKQNRLVGALAGSVVATMFLPIEGGLPVLPFMVITYALYTRVVWRDLAYLVLAAAMFALAWQPYDTWQATVSMLAQNSDFMLVLVIPVLHLYNGEHGPHTRFSKYFFYVFYPAHLWLLALIAYFQAA